MWALCANFSCLSRNFNLTVLNALLILQSGEDNIAVNYEKLSPGNGASCDPIQYPLSPFYAEQQSAYTKGFAVDDWSHHQPSKLLPDFIKKIFSFIHIYTFQMCSITFSAAVVLESIWICCIAGYCLRNLISYTTQFPAAFALKLCCSVHSEVLPHHIILVSLETASDHKMKCVLAERAKAKSWVTLAAGQALLEPMVDTVVNAGC